GGMSRRWTASDTPAAWAAAATVVVVAAARTPAVTVVRRSERVRTLTGWVAVMVAMLIDIVVPFVRAMPAHRSPRPRTASPESTPPRQENPGGFIRLW